MNRIQTITGERLGQYFWPTPLLLDNYLTISLLVFCFFLRFSALLWHRLMGRNVLSTGFNGTEKIRAYAHCSKQSVSSSIYHDNLKFGFSAYCLSKWNKQLKAKTRNKEMPPVSQLWFNSQSYRKESHYYCST